MKCPNCGKEMKYKATKDYGGFLDTDDCLYYLIEKWSCKKCKISFNKDYKGEEWDIPGELQATQAQIKACRFVSDELGYDPPPPIKRAMWKFLKDYLEEAQNTKEKRWIENWDDYEYDYDYDYSIPKEDCY